MNSLTHRPSASLVQAICTSVLVSADAPYSRWKTALLSPKRTWNSAFAEQVYSFCTTACKSAGAYTTACAGSRNFCTSLPVRAVVPRPSPYRDPSTLTMPLAPRSFKRRCNGLPVLSPAPATVSRGSGLSRPPPSSQLSTLELLCGFDDSILMRTRSTSSSPLPLPSRALLARKSSRLCNNLMGSRKTLIVTRLPSSFCSSSTSPSLERCK